ncbi:UrcA family protein [Sphingomonas sp. AP4-R1]|uniref:UrcA family protein n=1 Tax=Sphingomonas sp. AP4-R1 TaxID=2735134 RepID=UPI0014937E33|nr:UrcA family protein [Sphingomonas sp. AP4-R1]QJU56886.1 UrcA family protein [Sphingomonas sp. AP4-R1]
MNNRKSFGSAFAKGALGLAATCLFTGAALAETTVIVQPEAAAQTRITMQQQVRYGDLDLSTAEGRATLNQRVRFAASDVCDGKNVDNTRSPIAYLDCYTDAVRGAKQQLNQRLASAQGSTVTAVR